MYYKIACSVCLIWFFKQFVQNVHSFVFMPNNIVKVHISLHLINLENHSLNYCTSDNGRLS